ncbi:MAG: response regulator transcription factor [Rhodothermales bacterium]|nr:response regulator transcription factor [Rhodothermales bacterium]MBO6780666.1 response regulator transcription factor [Rhodothermales bacterium]
MTEPAIRVMLADDHGVLREGLAARLGAETDLSVVASVSSGQGALDALAGTHVDVLVSDQSMPEIDGLTLAREVRRLYPDTAVLILTMHEDGYLQEEARRAGARGLVLKRAPVSELASAIRTVSSGGEVFPAKPPDTPTALLSPRERQVLKLVVAEQSNLQIAETLFISVQTVETHRKNIFRKTGAGSLVGLVNFAHANGLLQE